MNNKIYFDNNKKAYAFEIDNPLCIVDEAVWKNFAILNLGSEYDVTDKGIVDLRETTEYKAKEAKRREQKFKSDFFEIPSFGWFRKVPKGYSSAVESLNTAFNIVSVLGILPSDTLIFYSAPDFSDPEQCTEDWLIAHQTKNKEMNTAEFGTFYAEFITAWNNQEHVKEVENA